VSLVQGVVVASDFIRSDRHGVPGEGDRSAVWVFDAVKRQVEKAANLPVTLLTAGTCPGLRSWVEAQRTAEQADAFWAANYDRLAVDAALEGVLLRPIRRHFVIGHEMPPYLRTILAEHGVPYLDIRIHPIRFLDDLLFAVQASESETQAALLNIAVSEETVLAAAGLIEAMCRYTADCTLAANTLLVIGQRTMDSSQIIGGRFFDALSRLPEIRSLCDRYSGVLLKAHPYGGHHSLLLAAAAVPNVLAATSDNVYRLLAQPEIGGVLTVNSSSAYEARYFGKRVHTLASLPVDIAWRGEAAPPGSYISLDDYLLSVDFWRLALRACANVGRMTDVRLPPKPNRIRIAHDSFWNFHEIDTDRIPRSSKAVAC